MKANASKTRKKRPTSTGRPSTAQSRKKLPKVIELVPSLLKIKSILVPLDFSDPSKKALIYAVRMAEQFGSRIIMLSVIEPVATPDFTYHPLITETDAVKKSVTKRLDALCQELKVPGNLIERKIVRYGTPFAEITSAARTLKVDLIIVTTHGYTGLKHVIMGSTSERVVRHAPCPVLTVRSKEKDFV
jgi:nucleotide-binding universal stress UspA family protein